MAYLKGALRRYQAGAPLSVLDGVPYTIIDGIDALPYPTTAGTSYVRPWLCCCTRKALSRTAPALQRDASRVCCADCMRHSTACAG